VAESTCSSLGFFDLVEIVDEARDEPTRGCSSTLGLLTGGSISSEGVADSALLLAALVVIPIVELTDESREYPVMRCLLVSQLFQGASVSCLPVIEGVAESTEPLFLVLTLGTSAIETIDEAREISSPI
jgi:hypothetical protein